MNNNTITLNDTEIQLANLIGNTRYEINRYLKNKCNNVKEDADRIGALGELAFAKFMNLYPDMSINHRREYDFIYRGWRIDVKTSDYENGNLGVPKKAKNKPADLYFAVIYNKEAGEFEMSGFQKAEYVFKHGEERKDIYLIYRSALRKPETLRTIGPRPLTNGEDRSINVSDVDMSEINKKIRDKKIESFRNIAMESFVESLNKTKLVDIL